MYLRIGEYSGNGNTAWGVHPNYKTGPTVTHFDFGWEWELNFGWEWETMSCLNRYLPNPKLLINFIYLLKEM